MGGLLWEWRFKQRVELAYVERLPNQVKTFGDCRRAQYLQLWNNVNVIGKGNSSVKS